LRVENKAQPNHSATPRTTEKSEGNETK
jgi:hypothetical protein